MKKVLDAVSDAMLEKTYHMKPEDLKRIRKGLGLTQVELAKRVGASEISVIRWENGHNKPLAVYERQIRELAKKKRGVA